MRNLTMAFLVTATGLVAAKVGQDVIEWDALWAPVWVRGEADKAALRIRHHDDALHRRFAPQGESIPRPAHWGGYLIVPERVEFWQGRRSRLHDRLVYMRQFGGWHIERLAP